MSSLSSYAPFVIGKFQTGQFQYLQPWQRAEDAFDPMINCYTYRGSVYKRDGYSKLGHTGLLRYCNSEIATTGNGGGVYSGTLSHHPIAEPVIGDVVVTVRTSSGLDTFTYNDGTPDATKNLTYSATGLPAGNLNLFTGVWSINTAPNTVAAGMPIVFHYTFTPSQTAEILDFGDGTTTSFSGTLTNFPILPNSLFITVKTVAGVRTATDDGYGFIVGDLTDLHFPNTINYETGAWVLNTTSPPDVGENIEAFFVLVGAGSPIMGINTWINETTNSDTMTVEDQRRLAVYNPNTKLFDPICCIDEDNIFGTVIASGTGPFSFPTNFTGLAPYSVTLSDGTDTIQDFGDGTFRHNGNALPDGTNFANTTSVDYTTGVITLKLVAAAIATYSVIADLQGDYFTGTDINFFNFANWKPNDSLPGLEYLTNNKDRVTTFDGTCLARPNFIIREVDLAARKNGIATTSDIKVYKNRLLFFRPTIIQTDNSQVIEAQIIRFSSQFYTFGTNTIIPYDFIADVAGHGGTSEAPTPDWIIAAEFLRDVIIVFMQKSTWIFRFTGSAFNPFVWQQLNSSRTSNAVYGSLAYDNNCTSMGTKGLISCDGTNVDRYDIPIIDTFEDIDNDHFIQCIARRDDIMNQSWMIYPSQGRQPDNRFSDRAIIYNFLENTFAKYAINLSTIGVATTFEDIIWSSFALNSGSWVSGKTWVECNFPWNNALSQNLAPTIYGGNQNGYVYTLNVNETDDGTHIDTTLVSKRWNPVITNGERCRFGYIDIYYLVNPNITLVVELFVNNTSSPSITKQLVLDGPVNNDYAWKRIQVNIQGEFVRMNITTPVLSIQQPSYDKDDNIDTQKTNQQRNEGSFIIAGIILWAAPAGRLVPGGFA